ncbi:MAG: hypothetical protein K0S35_982 [Geminicoccaceae bacterium]|nr:hypothetical protein [Geminicoccaceae bacterium]
MADEEQLSILRQGAKAWNAWRHEHQNIEINLRGADLIGVNLSGVNLSETTLTDADLRGVILTGANLSGANLSRAFLHDANFSGAILSGADLSGVILTGANLSRANLSNAILVGTRLDNANLTNCNIHGISAWNLDLEGATQKNLIITSSSEPEITVDNLEVAQFIYLLLRSEKIRNVIDAIGKKGVLLLGRFTEGRLAILERLRDELRQRGFLPMVFNFDKPETKDFTETVRLLAGMSRFVIVDITNPRSAPLELQATVPEYMIPFVPILEKGEEPFAMFKDLWVKHRAWVLDPIRYPSVDRLIEVLDAEIIKPAEAKFAELLARKAEDLRIRDI